MNIVFDLGMVLIEWDPRHVYRKVFSDDARMEWFLSEVCHGNWNLEQDRGRTWTEAEAEAIARHPAMAREIRLYRERWHDMVPGAIAGTVAILEELDARGAPLYAVTNWASDTFAETRRRFSFLDRFRDIVVSGDEKIIKPDAAIFELLCRRNGLEPGDCIFIDDSLKNVKGAEALGWQGHHFSEPTRLRADLTARGLL
ncbi:MAG: HAD family phosphatase [Proteobacteria bacterium]|nr:HAD family phosphatase [Pseudomonadota bacterium]